MAQMGDDVVQQFERELALRWVSVDLHDNRKHVCIPKSRMFIGATLGK